VPDVGVGVGLAPQNTPLARRILDALDSRSIGAADRGSSKPEALVGPPSAGSARVPKKPQAEPVAICSCALGFAQAPCQLMDSEQSMEKPHLKIEINGQRYDSIEQMPPEIREEYLRLVAKMGDADDDGIPDRWDQAGTRTVVEERYVINGKEYRDLSEVPPELRQTIEEMKHLKPGESVTVLETDTKVIGPDGRLIDLTSVVPDKSSGGAYWLIGVLLAVLAVLLFLWLSGIKPADLFHG
jgi:hypothetical protein